MHMSRSNGPRSRGTDTVTSDGTTNPPTTASAGQVRRSLIRTSTPADPAATSTGKATRVAPRILGSLPSTYSASSARYPGSSNMVAAPVTARCNTDDGCSTTPLRPIAVRRLLHAASSLSSAGRPRSRYHLDTVGSVNVPTSCEDGPYTAASVNPSEVTSFAVPTWIALRIAHGVTTATHSPSVASARRGPSDRQRTATTTTRTR